MDQTFELTLFKSENYGDLAHLDELVKLVDKFLVQIGLQFKYAGQVAKNITFLTFIVFEIFVIFHP